MILGNFEGRGWDGSITDENHISDALEELGHKVSRWQRENGAPPFTNGELGYDFFLFAQWDGYGDWIPKAKSYFNCPFVYWAFDYQADGQEWHERLVKESDLYLSKRIADSKYPNWQWLSQDFAPSFLDKWDAVIDDKNYELDGSKKIIFKDIDVLFTGSYLDWATERNETLKAVDEKFNLVIHSVNEWPGFKNVRPPIMDEGLPELYARTKVVLSIDHTIEAGYHSDRVAQALCCGGFVLHRYIPMDEVSFKDNVVYFYNTIDCLSKVQYYLSSAEQRDTIAEKGYLYAQSNMKTINRVQDLLIIVESLLNEENKTYSRADSVSRR